MAFNEEIGKDELLKRAVLAAAPYSERGLVYAGFSLGASIAQTLALGDEKAWGLLLLHGLKRPAGLPPAATTASPYDVRRCVQGSWNRGGGPVCLVGQASEAIFRRRERG
jgi:hypothetical protein